MSRDAWWPDPRSVLTDRCRSDLENDGGFRDLFDSLIRSGPRGVPERRRVASMAGRSESTFRRHFPAVAGMAWRSFLTAWRVQCGRVMMRRPLAFVKETARACGFRSAQGFSRAYRARFGEPPRRRKREAD